MTENRKKRELRAPERMAVLVLGPPRSGTSAVSHMLSELGVAFGDPAAFIDPACYTHNPIFFELRELNAINDAILARLGVAFVDFDFLPSADDYPLVLVDEFAPSIGALVDRYFSGGPWIGLKDPRFVFTLPVWKKVLHRLGFGLRFVLTEREGTAVAASNAIVNRGYSSGHNQRISTLSRLLGCWQVAGEEVAVVGYDALVTQPLDVAQALADWLGVGAGQVEAAAGVIVPDLGTVGPSDPPQGDLWIPASPQDIATRAEEYVAWRHTMADTGFLSLVEFRRRQVVEANLAAERAILRAVAAESSRALHPAANSSRGDQLTLLSRIPGALVADPAEARATLYWRAEGQVFSQERSIAEIAVGEDGRYSVDFVLPDEAGVVVAVRFDPDDTAGIFVIEEFVCCGLAAGALTLRLDAVNEWLLPGKTGTIRFASSSNDPYVVIDMQDLLDDPAASRQIRVAYHRESLARALARQRDVALEALRQARRSAESLESTSAKFADAAAEAVARDAASHRWWSDTAGTLGSIHDAVEGILQQLVDERESEERSTDATHELMRVMQDKLSSSFTVLGQAVAEVEYGRRADQNALLDAKTRDADASQAANSNIRDDLAGLRLQLEALDDAQREFIQWTRRLNPGYWLRRMLPGRGKPALPGEK